MYLIITVLMICILSSAELDIFVPSFPEIQAQFNLSPFMTQLLLSLNFMAYCLSSLFVGAISDKYDKRKVLTISLCIFILGSIMCAAAEIYSILLFGRVLQGLGIAGPSVLGYVVIADEYPIKKQVSFIGWMHGLMGFVISAAPVLGSYITYYCGWRGNFIALLIFGVICFILSYLFIPEKNAKTEVSISLKTYMLFLKSKKLIVFIIVLCLFMVPYWVFIGISPILYRNDLGVSLEDFGIYQGTLAAVFAISSACNSMLINKIKRKKAFFIGIAICLIHILALCLIMFFNIKNPLVITLCMAIASAGVSLPINMLYPYVLEMLKNTKGKTSALITGVRLILSSVGLWLVSSSYNGTFLPIGIWIITTMGLAIFILLILINKDHKILYDE